MHRILIIEDENYINNMLKEALTKAGYECTQAFSGTEGVLYARNEKFSLIIMDLMLPGITGEEALGRIKAVNQVPVIIVSAKDSLESKVELLTAGAEDYITKPFELKELLARVAVQIRRYSESAGIMTENLKYKDIELNISNYSAAVNGTEIELTRQEFKILELLMLHPDRVFSKQDIYDYAWRDYYIGEDKTINVHISNIRKKLRAVSDSEYIETVWGIGFKLK